MILAVCLRPWPKGGRSLSGDTQRFLGLGALGAGGQQFCQGAKERGVRVTENERQLPRVGKTPLGASLLGFGRTDEQVQLVEVVVAQFT